MVRCSIVSCKSDSEADISKLSYHSYPSEPALLQKWIAATGRNNWLPKKGSKICSLHFLKRHLLKKNIKTYLHPDAIPNELPNDMENYMEYHIMGHVSQVRTKPGCTPSKFNCQPDRVKRPYTKKQQRATIEVCLTESTTNCSQARTTPVAEHRTFSDTELHDTEDYQTAVKSEKVLINAVQHNMSSMNQAVSPIKLTTSHGSTSPFQDDDNVKSRLNIKTDSEETLKLELEISDSDYSPSISQESTNCNEFLEDVKKPDANATLQDTIEKMPNDMERYMKYHLMGSVPKIRMKPGCMPTKYLCQQGITANASEQPNIVKKQRKNSIEECERYIEVGVLPYPSGRTVDEHENETTSIHEDEEMMIPKDKIKEEITIDEDENFIPCMQLKVKTELDPLERNEDQFSHGIGHDHDYYDIDISTQPLPIPIVSSAQESPQPIMLISRRPVSQPSKPQTTIDDLALNNKINKNMAMELQREKALNAKNKKTIEELRKKVRMLNSRVRRRNIIIDKLETEIKKLKS